VLRTNAALDGLQAAFDEDAELVALAEMGEDGEDPDEKVALETGVGYFSTPPFARVSRFAAAYGRMGTATRIPGGLGKVRQLPNEVVDRCFALEKADEKLMVAEIEEQAVVLAIEWVGTTRGRKDEFDGMREQLVRQMGQRHMRDALSEWLDPEKIRARNAFGPPQR